MALQLAETWLTENRRMLSLDSAMRAQLETLRADLSIFKEDGIDIGVGLGSGALSASSGIGERMSFVDGSPSEYKIATEIEVDGGLSLASRGRRIDIHNYIDGHVLRELIEDDASLRNVRRFSRGENLVVGPIALVRDIRGTLQDAVDIAHRENIPTAFRYEIHLSRERGFNIDISAEFDVAAGLGVGGALGIRGSFVDAIEALMEEGVYLNTGERFASAKYATDKYISEADRLSTIASEILSGVGPLISNALSNLAKVVKISVEAGVEKSLEAITAAGRVVASLFVEADALPPGSTVQITSFSPEVPRIENSESGKRIVGLSYSSTRVLHHGILAGKVVAQPASTVLTIISQAYSVMVNDGEGNPIEFFDPPLDLNLKVLEEDLTQNGFVPEDKSLARVYFFDEEAQAWVLKGGEFDGIEDITVKISRPGTYAVGIETEILDTTAPSVGFAEPSDGSVVSSINVISVEIKDVGDESDLALGSMVMTLNGDVVNALYDLETRRLEYQPTVPLPVGDYEISVMVDDVAGNSAEYEFQFSVVAELKADFDGNGKVDLDDFFLFVDAFGSEEGSPAFDPKYDLDGDGDVDFDDFFLFVDDFGKNSGKVIALARQLLGGPFKHRLMPNYPNPFNGQTMIEFELPDAERASLIVYDILGRPVRRIVDSRLPAGHHAAVWDGMDDEGRQCSAGVYFYQLTAGTFADTRKLMLVR